MKRLIFTLLYKDGYFILSRNFRNQNVGKLSWVFKNYNLEEVTNYIDELIIIDISKKKNKIKFNKTINEISKKTFIPLVVGGGIESLKDVEEVLNNGADKILINSLFYNNPHICEEISKKYGKQFLVASIDYSFDKIFKLFVPKNRNFANIDIEKHLKNVILSGAGEILLQSIDQDGTGNGLDSKILRVLKTRTMPIILMGG
ncbi:HisA/HisF-related TIM barrel protein, partial [Candidatus Pelagibacter sp.]|nr:HisA/HisF-related TIM barrel protein [Candidatus Pelagibacter sp.]